MVEGCGSWFEGLMQPFQGVGFGAGVWGLEFFGAEWRREAVGHASVREACSLVEATEDATNEIRI